MSGTLTPETTMAEVMEGNPGARRALFAKYHIGGCSQCAYEPEETLAELCARNESLPVDEVITHLEAAAEADAQRLIEPADLAEDHGRQDAVPALLDVRTREEFEHVCLEGSRLFTNELHQEVLGTWDEDRPIVFVDHLGTGAALDAAAFLAGHGFTSARALRGGIDAYSREVDVSLKRYRLEVE